MLLFKKLIKVLFDVVISKTPESWRPLRNLCVRTFCKWGVGISPSAETVVYTETR